jgi:hypothetical protein
LQKTGKGAIIEAMAVNIKYKDSVFSLLFSSPDLLRELYGAIAGIPLPEGIPIIINTLQNALFMGKINDISFEISDKIVVLIEHQSTINPNMGLRLLIYIANVYEKIIGDRNPRSSRLLRIPRPEFYVLYNGTRPYPKETRIKLSDAFESGLLPGMEKEKLPMLDLEVIVININYGENKERVEKCKALGEYSAFVQKVRDYEKETGNLEAAVRKAVLYCRDHAILKEFLEKNATEVLNMLTAEWNIERAQKMWFKDGLEIGRGEGIEIGLEKGLFTVAQNMVKLGFPIENVISATQLDPEKIKTLYQ